MFKPGNNKDLLFNDFTTFIEGDLGKTEWVTVFEFFEGKITVNLASEELGEELGLTDRDFIERLKWALVHTNEARDDSLRRLWEGVQQCLRERQREEEYTEDKLRRC